MKKVFFDGGENEEVETTDLPGQITPESEGFYM